MARLPRWLSLTDVSIDVQDLSTKLKLMGVDVASFGDYFADKNGISVPKGGRVVVKTEGSAPTPSEEVKCLTYRDPFSSVYKKYLFSGDGKYIIGGMMIGDTKDYVKLVGMVNKKKLLEHLPATLILGVPGKEGEDEGDELDDDAQICSCHNVLKSAIAKCIKEDGATTFGDFKVSPHSLPCVLDSSH